MYDKFKSWDGTRCLSAVFNKIRGKSMDLVIIQQTSNKKALEVLLEERTTTGSCLGITIANEQKRMRATGFLDLYSNH